MVDARLDHARLDAPALGELLGHRRRVADHGSGAAGQRRRPRHPMPEALVGREVSWPVLPGEIVDGQHVGVADGDRRRRGQPGYVDVAEQLVDPRAPGDRAGHVQQPRRQRGALELDTPQRPDRLWPGMSARTSTPSSAASAADIRRV